MKKRKKSFPKITVLLLAASAVLLVGSGVGSARAALTYYSENYSAQMNMQSIGVSLVENDAVVSSRDYVSDNEWSGTTEGTLLANMLGEDEKFTPGKRYNEAISVKNSGYIRSCHSDQKLAGCRGKEKYIAVSGSDRIELSD